MMIPKKPFIKDKSTDSDRLLDRFLTKRNVTASIVTLVIIILVIIIAGQANTPQNAYTSENSFTTFAKDNIKKYNSGEASLGKMEKTYEYGKVLSYATWDVKTGVKSIDSIISNNFNKTRKKFTEDYEDIQKLRSNRRFRPNIAALLNSCEVSTPIPEVNTLVTYSTIYTKISKTTSESTEIHAYNFSSKTGMQITPNYVLKGRWEPVYEKKAEEYLKDNHKKRLKSDFKDVLRKNSTNFIVTEDGLKFFYDSGTLYPESEGAVTVELSKEDLKGYIRDDIGKRVIDPDKPMVAITYDDGPHPKYTKQLLDIYEKNNAVCTFFELGQQIERVPKSKELLQRELDLGCEIGTHSYNHKNLKELSTEQLKKDAKQTYKAVDSVFGIRPTVMRAPYGNGSKKIAKVYGVSCVNWSIDSKDWDTKSYKKVVKRIKKVKDFDGEIILMHSIHKSGVKASAVIVPWLQDQGYQLVTVSELLQYKYNHNPDNVVNYGYRFMDSDKKLGVK
jgi:peptidoglycan/xylan/chitin deacetylase (PgdA/CDA1 family)